MGITFLFSVHCHFSYIRIFALQSQSIKIDTSWTPSSLNNVPRVWHTFYRHSHNYINTHTNTHLLLLHWLSSIHFDWALIKLVLLHSLCSATTTLVMMYCKQLAHWNSSEESKKNSSNHQVVSDSTSISQSVNHQASCLTQIRQLTLWPCTAVQ